MWMRSAKGEGLAGGKRLTDVSVPIKCGGNTALLALIQHLEHFASPLGRLRTNLPVLSFRNISGVQLPCFERKIHKRTRT